MSRVADLVAVLAARADGRPLSFTLRLEVPGDPENDGTPLRGIAPEDQADARTMVMLSGFVGCGTTDRWIPGHGPGARGLATGDAAHSIPLWAPRPRHDANP